LPFSSLQKIKNPFRKEKECPREKDLMGNRSKGKGGTFFGWWQDQGSCKNQ